MDREILRGLIEEGKTIRAMAADLGVSYTTVRYWLERHGLQTPRGLRLTQTRAAREGGDDEVTAFCVVHGTTKLVTRPEGGFRCLKCRNAAVTQRRREMKTLLVQEAGGRCVLCGYSRSVAALHFHHVDPTTKSFTIAGAGVTRSVARARVEARKCILLCANCHAEVEVGARQVPFPQASASADAADPR
ncbi:MAG: hypothetical protein JWP18_997 [Solirubrobacterales bacterium]|nr:hypothetical protein [Solirubrobacterales bacterium]